MLVLCGCTDSMMWQGVNRRLLANVDVSAELVGSADLPAQIENVLAARNPRAAEARPAGSGEYLVVSLRNRNNEAIWGAMRVRIMRDQEVDFQILHIEPNSSRPVVFVAYVGKKTSADEAGLQIDWISLSGK